MRAFRWFYRQKRPFHIPQLAGLIQCGAAIVLAFRPHTLVFDWLDSLFDINPDLLTLALLAGLLICGFVLALHVRMTQQRFALLTLPVLIYGGCVLVYALYTDASSLLPGYLLTCFWATLQVLFDIGEGVYNQWNSSTPS